MVNVGKYSIHGAFGIRRQHVCEMSLLRRGGPVMGKGGMAEV